VHLALDDHRVDDVAAIIDGDEPPQRDGARAAIDVDDGDVGAEGVREIRRIVVVDRLEPGSPSFRASAS
jgi:hypothetical protein